jgi:RNA polymerase sigma factor (sigma-70 family)
MQTQFMANKQSSDLTDDILVHQAHRGDQAAFEMLVNRYSALLLRLIFRLVRDEHLAHDVLQHVFLQLYRSLPELRTGGTLKGWLCQVARHRSIDELRREQPLFFSEIAMVSDGIEYSPLFMLPDPDRQPEEEVELRELRKLLTDTIERLPSRYRTVVQLRYGTQLSFREIEQALSIPAAMAKTYFYRAKKPLCVLLEPEIAGERDREEL